MNTHEPPKTITAVKRWMQLATADEQELLAARAGTSRGQLYQLAGQHRQASPAKAFAIERASKELHKASKGRLPIIWRTDLVESCRQCEFAQKCLGSVATVSEFPIVQAQDLAI